MKILALESSAVSASVALTEDEKLVAQSFQNCGLTHSRTLLPMAESLLANCGVAARTRSRRGSRSRTGRARSPACASAWRRSRGWRSARTSPASACPTLECHGLGRAGAGRPAVLRDGRARGTGLQRAVCHRGRRAAPPVPRTAQLKLSELGEEIGPDAVFSGWRRRGSVL